MDINLCVLEFHGRDWGTEETDQCWAQLAQGGAQRRPIPIRAACKTEGGRGRGRGRGRGEREGEREGERLRENYLSELVAALGAEVSLASSRELVFRNPGLKREEDGLG